MTDYFTITRTLQAAPDRVFDVLTLPEHFSVWFGTAAVKVPLETLTMEVHPGGSFAAIMHLPDGNQITWSGRYHAVERPTHLAMTLSDQPGDDTGLPVLFDLEPADDGTTLTIRQDRSDFSDEQVAATVNGYNAFVDTMEQVLRDL